MYLVLIPQSDFYGGPKNTDFNSFFTMDKEKALKAVEDWNGIAYILDSLKLLDPEEINKEISDE